MNLKFKDYKDFYKDFAFTKERKISTFILQTEIDR